LIEAGRTMSASNLCWVLTEAEHPHRIIAASAVWYAVWQLSPADVIGQPIKVLDGPGTDVRAGKTLMQQFAMRGVASQRCANNRRVDGTVVRHTVSLVRAPGGLLAISSEMDIPAQPPLVLQHHDGHASQLDISARIASEMHANHERSGAPAVRAADIAAASLDEMKQASDQADEREADLTHDEASSAASASKVESGRPSLSSPSLSSRPLACASIGSPPDSLTSKPPMLSAIREQLSGRRANAAKPSSAEGSGSHDSTMTSFAAEFASAEVQELP